MAFRAALRTKLFVPAALSAATAVVLLPKRKVFAEEPPSKSHEMKRKPIYDDRPPVVSAPLNSSSPTATSPSAHPTAPSSLSSQHQEPTPSTIPNSNELPSTNPPYRPTPTDRLTAHITHTRLLLTQRLAAIRTNLSSTLTRALALENSLVATISSTLSSIPPDPSTNETLLPGSLYVLVAGMAGSIVSRNRNVLLRMTTPLAFAVGIGYAVIPHTMRNVGGVVWRLEERLPVVRDAHLRVKEAVVRNWETGKAHAGMTVARVEEGVEGAREGVEEWLKKGK